VEDLPKTAQRYVSSLEAVSGARFAAIGVGPGREDLITMHDMI
jgi:adenylosuccinate synthase